uniref:Interleukin 2 receptor, beta n=1 Tax=Gasterosteus aculeatus TaxID=69293 RepID=G3NZ30_GASAC
LVSRRRCSATPLTQRCEASFLSSVSRVPEGLSCVNDFVNNVSCTWDGSGLDCWIVGMKITWAKRATIIRSCKLKQHRNSPSGCSFVFENEEFNPFMKEMPYIRVECNGTMVENITNYSPFNHVKMHPPSVPNVSCTPNRTLISWSPGGPPSDYFKSFNFQVQIKQKNKSWNESNTLFTQEQELIVASWKVKGPCQVRVRVKPVFLRTSSHWSDWSPTTSWLGATDTGTTTQDEGLCEQMLACVSVFVCTCAMSFLMARFCHSRLLKGRPVPNPSKYFHTLHSVHGGNVKEWLNPPSAAESFFTAQPCDSISPVEICEGWDVVATTSPSSSSSSALLHSRHDPRTAGSDTSGVVDDSSSSSSFFSNVGYFISSSSGSLAPTGLGPAHPACRDDFRNTLNLRLSLHPALDGCPTYESLTREPHSPDSGLGIAKEDEDGDEDTCPCAPPAPNAPTLTTIANKSQQAEVSVAAAHGHYAAWPVPGAMCRSSSMPVEPCKTGYLTLKELQTTFSNKSI